MTSFAVTSSQDVKKKWFDVIVECLVIQKQFGQQAEVLAINLAAQSVNFKDRQMVFFSINDVSLSIDFCRRRTPFLTFVLSSKRKWISIDKV